MAKYRPQFISMKEVFCEVISTFSNSSLYNEQNVIEALKLQDLPGYYTIYEDFIKQLANFDSQDVKSILFEKITEKIGFLPISDLALKKVQDLFPDIIKDVNTEYLMLDCERIEEIFHKPDGLSFVLKLCAKQDEILHKHNAFCLYQQEETLKIYLQAKEDIIKAIQAEKIDTFYYDIEFDEMTKLSHEFWFSKNHQILWKEGTIFIKGKYQECFIEKNGSKKIINKDNFSGSDTQDLIRKQGIIEFNYQNDHELMNSDVRAENFDNIKDSLAGRVYKLALICDSLGYRTVTSDTLADYIYHTQDWYFEGTQKTMSLAKKAASMIRSLEAAKGGTAYDLRKFDPKAQLIK